MKINNIQKLKNFGIYKNHSNSGAKDFGKFNLFYGWNGSGKSTLSSLFHCLEKQALPNKFPSAEFTVNLDAGTPITHQNIADSNLNIYTFSQDFIDENISWSSVVKSILLVDKEKIAGRKQLDKLKKEQLAAKEKYDTEVEEIKKLSLSTSKFGTESARHLKTSLQSIDTTDKYYLNYNKSKFEKFIDDLNPAELESNLIDEQKIVELTNAAKPNHMPKIVFSQQSLDQDTFIKDKEHLDDLLKTSLISKTLQQLIDHKDIKSWVETGLELHKSNELDQCEFCGNTISQARSLELEAHFNDDYKVFQNRLAQANDWLENKYITPQTLPSMNDLFDEFKIEYEKSCAALENSVKDINTGLEAWHNVLNEKIANPHEIILAIEEVNQASIIAFNDSMKAIQTVIDKHNHKSINFSEETTKAKKKLELHYSTTEVNAFGYHEKKAEETERTAKNRILKTAMDVRDSEIRSLENSLSNESLGAYQFNESLHKFLGRSELTLRFNSVQKGYEIIRNNSELVDGKLSEGEKTAVAFVYFITKLKENDNNLEDSIIVVDDPVSSFDSNHLFHSYSFLRNNCDTAKQLFVLTHNFTYYKLMRDWFEGTNRNRRKKGNNENSFFYTIEASTDTPRQSTFKNADSSLVKYNSEYHYIFSRLYRYKDNPTLSRDDAFLTANLARKLLESFFSFKFPKHRSDIAALMECGLKGCLITDEVAKEKIYRFINKYSHSVVIDVNEDSSENLMGESQNVLGDIFTWIHEIDEVHYNEMVEVVNGL